MDQLSAMRAFRRVVECGGFSKGAQALGLSSAGVSKQVRLLEERLGVVLIHRTTRRMGLTPAGETYFQDCRRILDELAELDHSVSTDAETVSGRLRINAPLSFGVTVLSPILTDFMAAHPGLKIDLDLSDQVIDMVQAGFDLSIRVRSELTDSSLVVRKLADVSQVICAAPAYVAAHGAPATADHLHHHACLAYSLADHPGVWRLESATGRIDAAITPRLSVNNSLMLRDLLIAGAGVGPLPSFLAKPALAAGTLVPVLPDYAFAPRHVFAVYPTGRHLQRKVRVFVDFLADALKGGV